MILIEALLDELYTLRRRARMTIDDLQIHIAKLHMQPGDVLVVKCPTKLHSDQMAALRNRAKQFVPDHEVLVLCGVDLAVRRGEEDQSLDWD